MARFTAATTAQATVAAPRRAIWDVLTDPAQVARLTPFLERITAEGDRWRWEMSGLEVLGIRVAPAFTERMVFDHLERIEFHHEPPTGAVERCGVNGWYALADAGRPDADATALAMSLSVTLELPLPRVAAPAVTATVKGVLATMGDRFSRNLLDHLGIRR